MREAEDGDEFVAEDFEFEEGCVVGRVHLDEVNTPFDTRERKALRGHRTRESNRSRGRR